MRVGELRVASLRVASWLTNLRCRIFLCYYFFRSSPRVFHRSIIFQKETTQLLFLLELSVTLVLLWNYFSFLIVLRQSKSTFLVLIFEKYVLVNVYIFSKQKIALWEAQETITLVSRVLAHAHTNHVIFIWVIETI